MGKRLVQEVKRAIAMIVVLAVIFFVIWLLSYMGGVLAWLKKNWSPAAIGFGTAVFLRAIINMLCNDEKSETYEDEEEDDESPDEKAGFRSKK